MPARRAAAARSDEAPAKVLIVDDSVVARAVMAQAVAASGVATVAGSVPDAPAALAFLAKHSADIILLDVELPGVDGLTALPDLITAGKGAPVLIVSSSCGDGAAATLQALALGAADTLAKPAPGALAGQFAATLAAKIGRLLTKEESAAPPPARRPIGADFDIVAVAASTGGIHAMSRMLRMVPADFTLPILVTQHLPESFTPYFATQVALLAGRPCDIAEDHLRVRPGRVILAPGNAHIRCVATVDGAAIRLSTAKAASGCMPSADPMFESLAESFGARALAVVLSGMGRDGAIGIERLVHAGGTAVVQDRESSVIWGMPGAAAKAGAVAALPPEEIGALIATRRRPA